MNKNMNVIRLVVVAV